GSGGNYDGFIGAADKVLAMANDKTKIIPGHGALSEKPALKAWRDMLAAIRDKVKKLADAGQSLTEGQAAKPTTERDAKWGGAFIKPEQIVEYAYKGIKGGK